MFSNELQSDTVGGLLLRLLVVHLERRLLRGGGKASFAALPQVRYQHPVANRSHDSFESWTAMIVQPSADGPAA